MTFPAKRNLTRHIGLVHAKTQVTCEKCGKHFTREDNLKRHLVRCNPKNSGTLTCEKCQKKFSSKSNLNKHMKTHATPLLWMMDGQKVDFMRHESLEKDIENFIQQQMIVPNKEIVKSVIDIIVNKIFDKKWFKCTECIETFISKKSMNSHKANIHILNKFKCTECTETFATEQKMKRHISLDID